MSNHQYKTAPNFTIVTHANNMLGRFNIRNSAPALCLDIPFHKKRKLSLTPEAGRQPWRNYCPAMCHDQPEILAHGHTHTHADAHTCTHTSYPCSRTYTLYTGTRRHTHHLQDLQLIPHLFLKFLFYIFLFVILKNTGYSAKIISLPSFPSLPPPPPHFSLYLRDFNVAFLRSKRVHPMPQPLLRPTLKYKIVIHTILLIIYIPF